jgi:hypothetical protein
MVEMDIGIIAASLVVMRPCFEWFFGLCLGGEHRRSSVKNSQYGQSKGSSFKRGSGYQKALGSGGRKNRDQWALDSTALGMNITRSVDIKMESKSISKEEILRGDDSYYLRNCDKDLERDDEPR